LASVSLLATTTFCACDKDDDKEDNAATSTIPAGEYTIEVENGNKYNSNIDSVKLVIEHDDVVVYEVCSGQYANGKVTLDFSKSVPDEYLNAFHDEELPDELAVFKNLKISNPSVKTGWMKLKAYKWNADYSRYVGNIYHGTDEQGGGSISSIISYANDDVTITGSFKLEEMESDYKININYIYNVNLKKGWNIVYAKLPQIITGIVPTVEVTTQAPAGAVWRYEEDY
jgi:hypothetical protein